MKTQKLLIALLAIALTIGGCQKHDPIKVTQKGKLQTKQMTSPALADNPIGNPADRDIVIYTPPGYKRNGAKEYPVVYLLHGLPFTGDSFISSEPWDEWIDPNGMFKTYPDFPQEGFRDWMDYMLYSDKIEPMIVVMPNAASAYGFSFYTNSVLNGNFEDYIVNDLVNYVDSNYRTIPNSNGRSIIGFSQGGYAAMIFGMKHSDKFSAVANHSGLVALEALYALTPVVIEESPDGLMGPDPSKFFTSAIYGMSAAWSPNLSNPPSFVDLPFNAPTWDRIESVWDSWKEHDPFTMLDTYGNNFRSLNGIYMDCGSLDELGTCSAYEFFLPKLDAMNIDYTYDNFEGGHFDQMYSRLEISLAFCSDKMN